MAHAFVLQLVAVCCSVYHVLSESLCRCTFQKSKPVSVLFFEQNVYVGAHFVKKILFCRNHYRCSLCPRKKHFFQNVFERRGDQRGRGTRSESKRKLSMRDTARTRRGRPTQACHASACHCVQVQVWQCLMGLAKWVESVESVECVECV